MLRIFTNFFDVDPCSDFVLWVSGLDLVEEEILFLWCGLVFVNERELDRLFFLVFPEIVFLDFEVVLDLGD